jgi:hypothetical protein
MEREGTIKAFSGLAKVTDLVFAAYVEKATMAETVTGLAPPRLEDHLQSLMNWFAAANVFPPSLG